MTLQRANNIWWRREDVDGPPPVTFFVRLTSIDGEQLAVRYNTAHEWTMEAVPAGGTYIYFASMMICVTEEIAEINARIHRRLNALQMAWVPREGAEPKTA